MKYMGEIVRNFRISRGLTLKEVCSENFSVAQLSKFERGDSEITFSKLLIILERMNISMEEFMFSLKDFELGDLELLLQQLNQHHLSQNIRQLERMIEYEDKLFHETKNKYHHLNSIMIKAMLQDVDTTFCVNETEKDIITDYLLGTDEWCYYEMILFANTIHLFNTNMLVMLSKEMVTKTVYYKEIGKNRKILIKTLINITIILLERRALAESLKLMKQIERLINKETYLYEKNVFMYVKGFYYYQKGDIETGKSIMQEAIHIFEVLESTNLAENYKEHFKQIAE